ncbi:unnamed protein product [Urochloa decumbens]|uniref:F-box domain-containing protein n=1 Tax=Urochloa decumbens TaxID=240449 RepID=A0ABC9BRI1_9POAL
MADPALKQLYEPTSVEPSERRAAGGGEMTRRRCLLPSSAAPALEDDDILSDILHRLPPRPSSLPRASFVCNQWRRLVSDPHFLRRFRERHRKPPMLGFFSQWVDVEFTSALDSPDRIPASRFSLGLADATYFQIVDCRHSRVLFLNRDRLCFLVWAPVTGKKCFVDFPPSFRGKDGKWVANGAVVCAASEQGHVHGGCHSDPFQVVLLSAGGYGEGVSACVYSSETCTWGNVVSVFLPRNMAAIATDCANTLVGNSVFWFLLGSGFGVLKFDLHRQSLDTIELPSGVVGFDAWCRTYCQFSITPADGGGLNLLYLSDFCAQVWKWKVDYDGGAGWMLGSSFDLNNLLSLKAGVDTRAPELLGMDEDDNTIFLLTNVGVFMLHLESMKFKKLPIIISGNFGIHYPFRSFYSAGLQKGPDKQLVEMGAEALKAATLAFHPQEAAKDDSEGCSSPVMLPKEDARL